MVLNNLGSGVLFGWEAVSGGARNSADRQREIKGMPDPFTLRFVCRLSDAYPVNRDAIHVYLASS